MKTWQIVAARLKEIRERVVQNAAAIHEIMVDDELSGVFHDLKSLDDMQAMLTESIDQQRRLRHIIGLFIEMNEEGDRIDEMPDEIE